ncbi:dipeptide/oligopeptide/nickel ABC transporter permease/ATP-binding protein [Saccharospirillum alexandrii]|uniref:dipeptide/oligopeptide/nickel ABC transporter permease/ATP-binding protein n=1 Tax=Saccharospirillum alexandrii TaxID=2448477 RepID=UPI000FD904BE|nr:dipeptide/oligopeptide/nickel ABC transporter permease/ATP-binding protein [Saccharospirillum alexandrii]
MTVANVSGSGVTRKSGRAGPFKLLMRNQLAGFGLVVLAVVLVLVAVTPWLPLADPNITDPAQRLLPPFTPGNWLGTDQLGRDMLSRLLWGTRVSLAVGIVATLVAATLGSTIGILAGYFGGRVDGTLMRGIDMLMAFPYILLALAIVAVLGPGLLNALYAIAIVNIPFFARNVRGVVVTLRNREFVDAARLSGKGDALIVLTEVLPNVLPVIVITMSTTVGWMILETAGLSFLGLGAQPPTADLGSILGEGRRLIINAPHVATLPGLVIFILVMSINLLGDGVRDALDPRLKAGALMRPAARTRVASAARKAPAQAQQGLLDVVELRTEFHIGSEVHRAVNGPSFSIAPGECLGIIGESGSGKSVTAMSLLGLVASPPGTIMDGQVNYRDENLLAVDDNRLRTLRGGELAYIFQDPLSTLHPLFSIGDQLVEALRAHQPLSHQAAWQKAVALLEQVRIPNAKARAKVYPHQLSGGMRQRVSIAMALANEPQLIIADEPTTALDVTVQAQVLKLLNQLRHEQNSSLMFITHDFGVVAELCDRVAVMYAGELVEVGPVAEVLARPVHPYTRRLIACVPDVNRVADRLTEIPGLPPKVNDLPVGCKFADRCDQVTDACRAAPVELETLTDSRQARCIFAREVL